MRHNILIQCHGNCIEVEKLQLKLKINIIRNYSLINLGVLGGGGGGGGIFFKGLGHPNDVLLAKTMS